jgi:cytochrome c peroxidase
MDRMEFRNTPSLRYLHSPIKFTEHFYEAEVTGGRDDEGPTGGRTWDGRVSTGHDQALLPLLDPNEMANSSIGEILERLRKTSYAEEFRQIVSAPGEDVLDNPDVALGWLTVAIETFEQSPADFHPFTSKFDAYLRDQVVLSAKEKRGLDLFNDIKEGNCASCYPDSHKSPSSHLPIFTDFGYVAIGVPRNKSLPANADPGFYDLGLCGPLRTDLKNRPEYCGLFRTPSLRNAALRKKYFHNGMFRTLKQVLDFYVSRDISPQKWYPRSSDGKVNKFDDLPAPYRKNINTDPPFAPLPGNKPRLTSSEINDIIAFLNTLSDGYVQNHAKR